MLGELDPEDEARALALLASDPDTDVRAAAAEKLARSTTLRSFSALVEALVASPMVRLAASTALSQRSEPGASEAIEGLLALREADQAGALRRRGLAEALARRTDPGATAALERLIEQDDLCLELVTGILASRSDPVSTVLLFAMAARGNANALHEALLRVPDAELMATVDGLTPYLRLDASSTPTEHARARVVLHEMERVLTIGSTRAGPLTMPAGWRQAAEAAAKLEYDLALAAEGVLLAAQWIDHPVEQRNVELGEHDDPPFPFLVIGFERDPHEPPIGPLPDGVYAFQHQYAGYSVWNTLLVGYGVALPASFEADEDVRRLLQSCIGTSGELPAVDRGAFEDALARHLRRRVRFESGCEALLLGEPDPICASVLGLPSLRFVSLGAPWRPIYADRPGQVTSGEPLSASHVKALVALGERLGQGAPRIMLVWGNSD